MWRTTSWTSWKLKGHALLWWMEETSIGKRVFLSLRQYMYKSEACVESARIRLANQTGWLNRLKIEMRGFVFSCRESTQTHLLFRWIRSRHRYINARQAQSIVIEVHFIRSCYTMMGKSVNSKKTITLPTYV